LSYNIFDVAKDALTGNLEMATPEEQKRRLEFCRACEHLLKIAGNKFVGSCKKCGCFMDMKVKFASASCPEGKW
jgi:hypothetical protein